jgi:hypothetical protein
MQRRRMHRTLRAPANEQGHTMSNPFTDVRALLGQWHGIETIAPSPWGEGGEAQSSCSYALALDGKAVLHDYQAQRDGKPWLGAHAVFCVDASGQAWSLFWFDSLGFVPSQPGIGAPHDDGFEFVRSSPRGRTRHSYRLLDADRYRMTLESSFDDGVSWVPVMHGTYTRVA